MCSGSTEAGVAARGFTRHWWEPAIPETVHRIPGPAGAAAQQITHTAILTPRRTDCHTHGLIMKPVWFVPAQLGLGKLWLLSSTFGSLKRCSGWITHPGCCENFKPVCSFSSTGTFQCCRSLGRSWCFFFFCLGLFQLELSSFVSFPAKCVFSDLCTSLLHS